MVSPYQGGGNYNDSTLRGRKLKKQISEVKSELLHYIYYFLKVEHFIKNSLEGELGLVDELNERGLTDISRHYVKSRRFVFPESLDKTECVYWEYRAWHVLNTFRKKTGLRIGDDDFIIEHGLLREYYNMMKTNISRQMMCDDKEEAFRKFGSQ